jgi:DNA helicase-2/ATP-dependent DNA helicase PcrA
VHAPAAPVAFPPAASPAIPPALKEVVARLNPEQRAAVTTLEGPLLVLAGAGSGKTRVITVRIAWLLAHGVAPEQLLAMTFTNRAASEMRERAAALCGGEASRAVTIGTFHSFCVRLLRERGHAIGLPGRFAICDSSDQLTALKGALRELRVAETAIHPGALQSQISLMKSRLVSPVEAMKAAEGRRELLVARSYAKYDECLRRQRMVDFDDLLLLAVKLLRESAVDRDALAERFRFVMVDEYQDTNAPQYELLRLIAGRHRNLCVVGDDDQSIYGWRGADVKKILGFERDFEGATVVRLETNYRSTEPILEAANRVIACNPSRHGKTLRSALGAGEPVVVKRVEDETAEADLAVREITDRMRDGLSRPGDFAILFRAATQARAFEAALRAKQVPYRLIGGMSFFDRKEVRDVLAYLPRIPTTRCRCCASSTVRLAASGSRRSTRRSIGRRARGSRWRARSGRRARSPGCPRRRSRRCRDSSTGWARSAGSTRGATSWRGSVACWPRPTTAPRSTAPTRTPRRATSAGRACSSWSTSPRTTARGRARRLCRAFSRRSPCRPRTIRTRRRSDRATSSR